MTKKLKSIIGIDLGEFFSLIRETDPQKREISVREARLIPVVKQSQSELALASIFLSTLKLVREFREMFLNEIQLSYSGEWYYYTEVSFLKLDEKEVRPDGMLLQVKAGNIKNAVIFEFKNFNNKLDQTQIESYLKVACEYGISKIVTISNEFVSLPTQSPLALKVPKNVDLYHFSWSDILTMAHILLYDYKVKIKDSEHGIKDPDQVSIMKEVVSYFDHEVSGIFGFTQMKNGWKEVVNKIEKDISLKSTDQDIVETVYSWQQKEKDLALYLSRKLGLFVKLGYSNRYKVSAQTRIENDVKSLINDKALFSSFKISGAVSDLLVKADFNKKTVRMEVKVNAPLDKTVKGQLGWLKRQVDNALTNASANVESKQICEELNIEIYIKHARVLESQKWLDFDKFELSKDCEIIDFRVVLIRSFGKNFPATKKFVEMIESMLVNFYGVIVQPLRNWVQPAPKFPELQHIENDKLTLEK